MMKLASLILTTLVSTTLFADWRCTAVDNQLKTFYAQHEIKKQAHKQSMAKCKSESKKPKTCIVEQSVCYEIAKGKNSQFSWRCFSRDKFNNTYQSELLNDQYAASIRASFICRRLSTIPSSCYVNLSRCVKQSKSDKKLSSSH